MASKEHVEILLRGILQWNNWRLRQRSADKDMVDLSGAELSYLKLDDLPINLSNRILADMLGSDSLAIDLTEANLSQSILIGAVFRNADMRNADLTRSSLVRANLDDARLRGADMSDANLIEARLHRADLSDTTLCGALFNGADLTDARLTGADLRSADLSRADLTGADLSGADLCGAKLVGSDLSGANLTGADLTDTDLSKSNLFNTSFYGAVLNFTDFSYAKCDGTQFSSVDLSTAKGMAEIVHKGPSSLSIDTLVQTNPTMPDVFLRGCGIPETFLIYLPSLVSAPIDFYSCFISYSSTDKSFARRLHDTLQGQGIRCWLDEKQMNPGDDIYEEIRRGIRYWDKVLLCCSQSSLGEKWWVDHEIENAFQKERDLMKQHKEKILALIPLNLDGFLFKPECANPKAQEIRSRLAADFTGWERDNEIFEREVQRVIKALRTDGGKEIPPPSKLKPHGHS